jgi:hypothetical protein
MESDNGVATATAVLSQIDNHPNLMSDLLDNLPLLHQPSGDSETGNQAPFCTTLEVRVFFSE